MLDSPLDEARGVLSRHINLPGLNWDRIQFGPLDDPDIAPFTHGVDLMGDRSMMLLPPPATPQARCPCSSAGPATIRC